MKGYPLKKNVSIDYKNLNICTIVGNDDPKFPLVLALPHSGRLFPQEFFEMTKLSEKELRLNEDLYLDEMFSPLFDKGIMGVIMNISRAFIDVNRDQIELDDQMFEDYPADIMLFENSRCRSGYGLIHRITANAKNIYKAPLSYKEVRARIENVYDVYHKTLASAVAKCHQKFGYCFVLDCHSMPSKICTIMPDSPKIDICLGDLFLQSCPNDLSQSFASIFTQKGYEVLKNVPYSGAYTTFHYCEPRNKIYTMQLEINRALYANENSLDKIKNYENVQADVCDAILNFAKILLEYKA